MKIYYFSGTGNTLYVAREATKNIDDVELVSIKSCLGKNFVPQGDVGIAFPLYAFGLPKMVRQFLLETDFSKVDYFFALQTRSASFGRAFTDVQKLAKRKLDAVFTVNMPSAYLPFGDVETSQKRELVLSRAVAKISKIANILQKKGKKKVREFFIFRLIASLGYSFWARFSDLGKKYFVDEKCTGCGICSQVCPSKCIQMKDGVPTWSLQSCQSCMACINYCPARAIQLNEKTKGYGRYHHPAIDWKQIVR